MAVSPHKLPIPRTIIQCKMVSQSWMTDITTSDNPFLDKPNLHLNLMLNKLNSIHLVSDSQSKMWPILLKRPNLCSLRLAILERQTSCACNVHKKCPNYKGRMQYQLIQMNGSKSIPFCKQLFSFSGLKMRLADLEGPQNWTYQLFMHPCLVYRPSLSTFQRVF